MNPMVYHSPFFVSLGGLLGKWRDNDNHRCCEICVAGYTAGHPRVASLALRAIHLLPSPRRSPINHRMIWVVVGVTVCVVSVVVNIAFVVIRRGEGTPPYEYMKTR